MIPARPRSKFFFIVLLATGVARVTPATLPDSAIRFSAPADTPPVTTVPIPGTPVELVYRALHPGEILLAALKDDPAVTRIVFRWLGQTRQVPAGPAAGKAVILLGIDVAAEPGPFVLEVVLGRADGSSSVVRQDLVLAPREFPSTRLEVEPSLISPPSGEAERIKRESELVAAVLGSVSKEWLGEGNFQFPLPGREPFPNFGQRRIYNQSTSSIHSGIDISAPGGTQVAASNSGRVVLAGSLYFSGNTVIIDHGLGVFTHYCHFSKLQVKRGDLVKKGDVIALVGSTGLSTGPHLHWSVRVLKSRVDPFSLTALPLDGIR